jgi:hypothetical protein
MAAANIRPCLCFVQKRKERQNKIPPTNSQQTQTPLHKQRSFLLLKQNAVNELTTNTTEEIAHRHEGVASLQVEAGALLVRITRPQLSVEKTEAKQTIRQTTLSLSSRNQINQINDSLSLFSCVSLFVLFLTV